jgi:hypothetical protein
MGKDKRGYRKEYQEQRRDKRKLLGLCCTCKNKAKSGTLLCEKCATLHNERRAKRQGVLRELGLCFSGDGNFAIVGSVSCADCLKRNTEKARARYIALRNRTLVGYGGKCACCGETIFDFLTLDHVLNNGAKERSTPDYNLGALYRRVIEARFPSEYQLLCWNCNCGRAKNGGICPHKLGGI